jgi:hypothetical protein
MAKTGRPRAQIDQAQFEKLCGLQCTEAEILAWFGVTDKTLTRWCKETYKKSFSEIFKEKRETGKISLRRHQWRLAEKNASMAIFLGKNYLGQKDDPGKDKADTPEDRLSDAIDKITAAVRDGG